MRIIQQFIPTILFIFLLMSCQSTPVNVTFEAKETVSFTGRGAAAGVMLDSLMPGGIAIGIAIDEGIAKEIYKNLRTYKPDFSIQQLIQLHLAKTPIRNLTSIHIKTFGFRTSANNNDQVSAWLSIEVKCKNRSMNLNYPSDFPEVSSAGFALVKTNGEASYKLLSDAVVVVIAQLIFNQQCY